MTVSPCSHDSSRSAELDGTTAAVLEIAAGLCQAMGDPARLRLLLWLAQREMCVTELVDLE